MLEKIVMRFLRIVILVLVVSLVFSNCKRIQTNYAGTGEPTNVPAYSVQPNTK